MKRTIYNRRGEALETPYEDGEVKDKLLLLRDDHRLDDFGQKLAATRVLSQEQLWYVHRIVMRALGQPEVAPVDMSGLLRLFREVKERTQRRWVYVTVDGVKVTLSRDQSRLHVSRDSFFRGSTGRDGIYVERGSHDAWLVDVLRRLAASPHEFLRTEGQRTGVCCYCNRALTTVQSVSVGYGPVCAREWGLPWGDVTTEEQLQEQRRQIEDLERRLRS